MQNRSVTKSPKTYTRADYTALRAYILKIPVGKIAELYYSANCPQVTGGLESFLIEMRTELIDRAIHANPLAAEALRRARDGGIMTDKALRVVLQLSEAKVSSPKPDDILPIWFRPRVAAALSYTATRTLGELIIHINRHGPGWWRPIPRLGKLRAQAILKFLSEQPGLEKISDEVLTGTAVTLLKTPTTEVIPQTAAMMQGGKNQGQGFCLISARNDSEAAAAFLEMVRDNPVTQEAYGKEIGRFLLWTSQVCQKPLADLQGHDVHAYQDFLADIPSEWIGPRVHRKSPRWRPFSVQISVQSQRYAWYVAKRFMTWLVDVRYILANPFNATRPVRDKGLKQRYPDKALPKELWEKLITSLTNNAQSAHHRLMLAAMMLIGDSGLRRAEAAGAERQNLVRTPEGQWLLSVLGKGNKWREVVASERAVKAIEAHWVDRGQCFDAINHDGIPLLTPIHRAPTPASQGRGAGAPYLPVDLGRAIARTIKRLALNPNIDLTVSERQRLADMTPHTLRHTFATLAIDGGVPIDVVQMMLGHANLATTSVYLSAERKRMLREINRYHDLLSRTKHNAQP